MVWDDEQRRSGRSGRKNTELPQKIKQIKSNFVKNRPQSVEYHLNSQTAMVH